MKTRTVALWLGTVEIPEARVLWIDCANLTGERHEALWSAIAHALSRVSANRVSTQTRPDLGNDISLREQIRISIENLHQPLTVVLDDYHHATSAENDLSLSELCGVSPQLNLIVIARRVTLLDRTLVTARTRVRLLGPDDLAIQPVEALELINSLGVPASDQLTLALERAQGWPLAIRAALSIGSDELYAGPPDARCWKTDVAPEAFDPISNLRLFALDWLALLPEHAERVLLAAAVLDTVSKTQLELSLSASGVDISAAFRQLVELGLLVEVAKQGTSVYRCHRSVQAPLRRLAEERLDPPSLRELYRTRAKDLVAAAPFTAFRLFCEAEDYAEAELLLARNFTTITNEVPVCSTIVRSLPEQVLATYPTLAAACVFLENARPTVAPAALEYLISLWNKGLQQRLPHPFALSADPIYLPLLCQAMVVARLTGDFERSATLMKLLESRLISHTIEPGNPTEANSGTTLIGSLPTYLRESAATSLMLGDITHTRRSLERLRQFAEQLVSKPWPGFSPASTRTVSDPDSGKRWMLVALSELAFTDMIEGHMRDCARTVDELDAWRDTNQVSAPGISWAGAEIARAHLSCEKHDQRGFHLATKRLTPIKDRLEAWPLLLIAETNSLRSTRGAEWALAHLDAALLQNIDRPPGNNKWSEYLAAFQIMLCTSVGALDRARSLLKNYDARIFPRMRIERARLSLFSGDDVEALLQTKQIGSPGTTVRQQLELSLICAIAAWKCGRTEEALLAAVRAESLLKEHGNESILQSVPYDLLHEVATAARTAEVCDLLAYVTAVPVLGRCQRYERLTEMELCSLKAIDGHRNAAQAAAALFVTPGTIKKHLASVYRKLRVSGRDDAILVAVRMGLLTQTHPFASPE